MHLKHGFWILALLGALGSVGCASKGASEDDLSGEEDTDDLLPGKDDDLGPDEDDDDKAPIDDDKPGNHPDAGNGNGNGNGNSDGGAPPPDAGMANCPGVPEPSDPCIPKCGNEKKIGQACTKFGFECKGGLFCTVDFSDTELAFCTRSCSKASDCGSNMACEGDPNDPDSPKGCVPIACTQ